MGLFGTGFFEVATSGQWSESSACGFSKECKAAKETISTVCGPLRAQYGENMYQSCVTMAQREPRPQTVEDVICINPVTAWENFGYVCGAYEPPAGPAPAGSVQLGGKKINIFSIMAVIVLILIVYLIYKRA